MRKTLVEIMAVTHFTRESGKQVIDLIFMGRLVQAFSARIGPALSACVRGGEHAAFIVVRFAEGRQGKATHTQKKGKTREGLKTKC